jgi:hypothetical protein
MRLVRLKLREPTPFWILKPINLQRGNPTSPMLNIDALTDKQKDVINKAVTNKEISLYDGDNNPVGGNLDRVNIVCGNLISVDDIEEEKELYPEIISVTTAEDFDIFEEEKVIAISTETYEKARVLLDRNGHTSKKMILSLKKSDNNLELLHACLEVESEDKKRVSVLRAIEASVSEY